MTEPLDLDALAALEAAATPGLWTAIGLDATGWWDIGPEIAWAVSGADAAFIAAVRNSLPALIERLRTAEAQLAQIGKEAHELHLHAAEMMRRTEGLEASRDAAEADRDAKQDVIDKVREMRDAWKTNTHPALGQGLRQAAADLGTALDGDA